MKQLKLLSLSTLLVGLLTVSCTEDDPEIKITGFSFSTVSVEVKEGTTVNLNDYLTIEGEDASKAEVVFTTDNEDVVTVDGTTLSAVAVGDAVIEATETNTNKTATIDVTVVTNLVAVTGVTISPDPIEVNVNESVQLTATVAPENATDKTVTWSLAMEGFTGRVAASVDDYLEITSNGLLKAKKRACDECTYKVTATTTDGEKTDEVEVTINYIPVTSITLVPSEFFEVNAGETYQMAYTVEPENATDKTVNWKITAASNGDQCRVLAVPSYDDYATVNTDGVITAIMPYLNCGYDLAIQATTNSFDSDASAETNFQVVQLITGLSILDPTGSPIESTYEVDCGPVNDFGYSYQPGDASNSDVTWSIDNDTHFSIDQNGVLDAKLSAPSGGTYTTKLTITAKDGSGVKKEITIVYIRDNCV